MLSVYNLFEGFTKGGRWIPYPNSVGSVAKKRPVKVLNPKASEKRYLPFKKTYQKYVESDDTKFKVGPTPKYFRYRRSNLPSYSKRYT